MNAILKLLGGLAIIAGITALESRHVAPADDCQPKDLDVRPPEKILPPKVENADGESLAGCPCGCACEGGCQCATAGPCSASCDCADYATLGERSVSEGKPLLVLVGGARTMYDAYPKGWLVCRVSALDGVRGPALVISTPHNGVPWYVAELPNRTSAEALQDRLDAAFVAMKPKVVTGITCVT